MALQSIEDACRAACESIGVIYKAVPHDGLFHVANLADDHKGKNDARIKVFQDRQGGIVWNHKSGDRQTFFINRYAPGEPTPPADRERIEREQQRRQLELDQRHEKAAQRARAIWQAAAPAPGNHPYLTRKQIQPHGVRVDSWTRRVQDDSGKYYPLVLDNALLLPLCGPDGDIRSLQAIFTEQNPVLNRDKDFMPGGGLAGLFW